jgi:hypothetical protein
METEPVSYSTFDSMAFTSPTFVSPFILIRDFVTNKGLRARLAVAWTIIASFYVLAFPSLNDTMSGYSTNMEAFLKDNSGILVPWSNYSEVRFIINDGGKNRSTESYLCCRQSFHLDIMCFKWSTALNSGKRSPCILFPTQVKRRTGLECRRTALYSGTSLNVTRPLF